MVLMKTDRITIPLYGISVFLDGKLVEEPKATGRFREKTVRSTQRELAFFYPENVEGKQKDGWDNFWGESEVIPVSTLIEKGRLDLFVDPEAAKEAIKGEAPLPEISEEDDH